LVETFDVSTVLALHFQLCPRRAHCHHSETPLAPDVSDELARRTVGILQGAAPSIAAE
jgi:hypothetical protein